MAAARTRAVVPAHVRSVSGRLLGALLAGSYAVAMAVGAVRILAGGTATVPVTPVMALFGVIGLIFGLRCWRHRSLDRRTRRSWGFMSLAYLLLLVFPVLFAVYPSVRFPGPGDVVRVGFALALAAGLLALPLRRPGRSERRTTGLDVATVVFGGFIVLWYLVVGPGIVTTGMSFSKVVAASVYPTVDLLLIFSVATALLRATDPSTRRPLLLLACAAASFILGDVYLGYLRSQGLSIASIETWILLVYLTAHVLMAAAAVQQHQQAGRSGSTAGTRRQVPVTTRLPYAAVALGFTLMIVAAAEEESLFPWTGLVLGSIGITAMVVARQMAVQRESHQLAVTDNLTGLANRAQLYDTLTRALDRDGHSGRITAVVLADMNGFKQINDTLGHQAGDRVLVAFGQVLRGAVLGSDTVARLGGDEFAIVLRDIDDIGNAEAVLRRIRTDMARPVAVGERSLLLRASFGVALSGTGTAGTDDLLHRADQAMYRAKRERNTDWVCYEPGMADRGAQRLPDDLPYVVDAGRLSIDYQPVDGRTG